MKNKNILFLMTVILSGVMLFNLEKVLAAGEACKAAGGECLGLGYSCSERLTSYDDCLRSGRLNNYCCKSSSAATTAPSSVINENEISTCVSSSSQCPSGFTAGTDPSCSGVYCSCSSTSSCHNNYFNSQAGDCASVGTCMSGTACTGTVDSTRSESCSGENVCCVDSASSSASSGGTDTGWDAEITSTQITAYTNSCTIGQSCTLSGGGSGTCQENTDATAASYGYSKVCVLDGYDSSGNPITGNSTSSGSPASSSSNSGSTCGGTCDTYCANGRDTAGDSDCESETSGTFCCKAASSSGGNYSTELEKETPSSGTMWNVQSVGGFGLPSGKISGIIESLVAWLLGIFGFLGIITFVIAGIYYFTAAGDAEMEKKAKNAMKMGIIGIVVGLIGFVIVQAVDLLLNAGTTF